MLNVEKLQSVGTPGHAYRRLKKAVRGPIDALRKEAKIGPGLHEEVLAALQRMKEENRKLEKVLEEAHAFAVLPSIGKASVVLGGAYGKGEVFRKGRVVGYVGLIQLTLGLQVGGETLHVLVVFQDKNAFKQLKQGKISFAAAVAATLVKLGADRAKSFGSGTSVYLFSEGGLLLQASIGAQKLIFRKAALGRMRSLEKDEGDGREGNGRDEEDLTASEEEEDELAAGEEGEGAEDEEAEDEEDEEAEDEEAEDEEAEDEEAEDEEDEEAEEAEEAEDEEAEEAEDEEAEEAEDEGAEEDEEDEEDEAAEEDEEAEEAEEDDDR